MAVKVTLQGGQPVAVEGDPDDVAAFLNLITQRIQAFWGEGSSLAEERVPSADEVAEYLLQERGPDAEHSISNITHRFNNGAPIPSRIEGRPNPAYLKWLDAAKAGRDLVEQRTGRRFGIDIDGRRRLYRLAPKDD